MALQGKPSHKSAAGLADDAWYDSALSHAGTSGTSSVIDARGTCSGSREGRSPLRGTFVELPTVLITEIFKHLDARELSVISCVCTLFRQLSSDSHGWKDFYCNRWGNPACSSFRDASPVLIEKTWKDLYLAREARSKAFLGRFRTDMMNGHSKAVRCVRLLSPAKLIFTAGYDSVIRIWDLEECLPLTWSRPLGFTLRAIAVDMDMMVVGGTDIDIRVWKATPGLSHIYDVAGIGPCASEMVLPGHEGPVTSLSLDETWICSGSWDMTVKVWDRGTLACIRTLNHGDWVWAVTLRNQRLVSTSGSDIYSWDVETGECLRVRAGAHVGQAYAVECTRSGHYVFSGGQDGIIRMYEEKPCRKNGLADFVLNSEPIAHWQPHSEAVYALAFEDPWLVSASGDGSLAMMDIRKVTKRTSRCGDVGGGCGKGKSIRSAPCAVVSTDAEPPQRMLFGFNQIFYSVDVGADRIVSAGEEQTVKVWDFSHALEVEKRMHASRAVRLEQRLKRKEGTNQRKGKHNKEACGSVINMDAVVERSVVWQRRGIKLKA